MQNYALMFLMLMNRFTSGGKLSVRADNPLVLQLDAVASSHFIIGRNMKDEPFLGVPIQFMPYFTQLDWMEASICREEGLYILEARDPMSQSLNMALALTIRRERLNVFRSEREDITKLPLSMKTFRQNPQNPDDFVVSEHDELIGIPQKEVSSIMEVGTDIEIDNAKRLFENMGMGGGFTSMTLGAN